MSDTAIHILLTDKELKALTELSEMQELSPERVMKQALRLYQMVTLGNAKVVFPDLNLPLKDSLCGTFPE